MRVFLCVTRTCRRQSKLYLNRTRLEPLLGHHELRTQLSARSGGGEVRIGLKSLVLSLHTNSDNEDVDARRACSFRDIGSAFPRMPRLTQLEFCWQPSAFWEYPSRPRVHTVLRSHLHLLAELATLATHEVDEEDAEEEETGDNAGKCLALVVYAM